MTIDSFIATVHYRYNRNNILPYFDDGCIVAKYKGFFYYTVTSTMDSVHYKRSSQSEDSLPIIDVDVVVIGAGISGLSAAYYLQKKDAGIRLAVLEAKGLRLLTSLTLLFELRTGAPEAN